MICFWCLNGIWGAFMLELLHQEEDFFLKDPPHPSEKWNFHLTDKIADFLHNEHFFW